MQTLPTAEALRACAAIGFDTVELMIYPGANSYDELQSAEGRLALQKLFHGIPIGLAALGEDLQLVVDPAAHQQNLERIKRAGALFQDLYPFWKRTTAARPRMPIVVLTLGGKSEQWRRKSKTAWWSCFRTGPKWAQRTASCWRSRLMSAVRFTRHKTPDG
jgi:inosose dehydratase